MYCITWGLHIFAGQRCISRGSRFYGRGVSKVLRREMYWIPVDTHTKTLNGFVWAVIASTPWLQPTARECFVNYTKSSCSFPVAKRDRRSTTASRAPLPSGEVPRTTSLGLAHPRVFSRGVSSLPPPSNCSSAGAPPLRSDPTSHNPDIPRHIPDNPRTPRALWST